MTSCDLLKFIWALKFYGVHDLYDNDIPYSLPLSMTWSLKNEAHEALLKVHFFHEATNKNSGSLFCIVAKSERLKFAHRL